MANLNSIKVTPSSALAKIVGSKPLSRPQIMKKLWDYIKDNDLQDSKNKRMINADENLKPIFGGKKQVTMFALAKCVSNNVE